MRAGVEVIQAGLRIDKIERRSKVKLLHETASEAAKIRGLEREPARQHPLHREVDRL